MFGKKSKTTGRLGKASDRANGPQKSLPVTRPRDPNSPPPVMGRRKPDCG